ncbi:hypothetical protein LLH00_09870 [bacterium]|nr:hypothetical protein [bacterium]
MDKHLILCVHITNRVQKAPEVQQLFTSYGNNIKTRLGLHEVSETFNSKAGVIILEMVGDEAKFDQLAAQLDGIEGVECHKVVFTHQK